jgi:hypothetical protein
VTVAVLREVVFIRRPEKRRLGREHRSRKAFGDPIRRGRKHRTLADHELFVELSV